MAKKNKATKKKVTKPKKKTAKMKKAPKKKAAKKKTEKKKTKPKKKAKRKPAKKKSKGKRGKLGKRYNAKQQARLLKKYHGLRKGGTNADKAAKKVGISYITLLKWEKKSGKKVKTKRGRPPGRPSNKKRSRTAKGAESALKKGRPPKSKKGGLTLVTPSGFRIEGITSAELIKVLRGLK